MSMRRLTPAFVATLSAITGSMACNPPRPLPGNPPPQPVADPQPGSGHGEGQAGQGEAGQGEAGANAGSGESQGAAGTAKPQPGARQQLNPRDAEGRTIYRNYNGEGCFVYLPYPKLKEGEMRPPGTAPPSQPTDCPAVMNDPAFGKCYGGKLSRLGDSCECYQPGNPPRKFASDCPK